MMGLTHQLFALFVGLWVVLLGNIATEPLKAVVAVLAVMVGALTPDLDHPTASLWKRLIGGRVVRRLFDAFSGGHRHLTHSVVGIVVIGYLAHWFITHIIAATWQETFLFWWVAYMVGYVSHPVLDSFTDQGVPWFWPLQVQVKLPPGPEELRVTTASWVETVLVRFGLVVSMGVLVSSNWFNVLGFFGL